MAENSLFETQCAKLFSELGENKTMVLSTSLDNKVTSRMMSIIISDRRFYFQTDITFRKYRQICGNHNVALCADNVQVEGICREIGKPLENNGFCELYKKRFSVSYRLYSKLSNERLFVVEPTYIKRWIYKDGNPFTEEFFFENRLYQKSNYIGE